MNVVDSCAWLEFFVDGPNAADFGVPIRDTDNLVVPSTCIYEVFRKVLSQRSESAALQVVSIMMQGVVADLDESIAMSAARLGLEYGLPFADAVILATARAHAAVVWTQDEHFRDIPGVRYFPHVAKVG